MNDRNKDTPKKKYRINGFEQQKRFFEIVQDNPNISAFEISLYSFLLNLNNSLGWCEWFSVPLSIGLGGSGMGENRYYKTLGRLEELHLIERMMGEKNRAPQIKIIELLNLKLKVDRGVDEPFIEGSLKVDRGADVRTYNNSITDKDKTKKGGVTFNEKKTPTFQNLKSIFSNYSDEEIHRIIKNTSDEEIQRMIESQKQVSTAEELKKYLMDQYFISKSSSVMKCDEQTFSKYIEQWVNLKEISRGFSLQGMPVTSVLYG